MSESATTETAGSVLDSSPGVSGLPSSPLSRDHGGATIRARSSVFGVRVKAAVAVHWVAATTRQNDFACTKRGTVWVALLAILSSSFASRDVNPVAATPQCALHGYFGCWCWKEIHTHGKRPVTVLDWAFDACNRCGFVVHVWHGFRRKCPRKSPM